jgi:asparagine synthase (glutamine-hydrolysing)
MRTPYLDNDLVKLTYQAPTESTSSNQVSLRLIADGNPALAALSTDRGILPRALPMLSAVNNRMQEFLFKAEYAYDYGMPQWVARIDNCFKPLHLERLFLGRHKFHHFRVWYRDQLSGYLKEVLLDPQALRREYLNGIVLQLMVEDHSAGRRNYTLELHRILTAELATRLLLN